MSQYDFLHKFVIFKRGLCSNSDYLTVQLYKKKKVYKQWYSKIETPVYGDRMSLFSSLAYNNFTMEEMSNGTAWSLLCDLG